MLLQYKRRQNTEVSAVQLDLDTVGFSYRKWGGAQRCKPGDWIVNNGGDVYTVDAASFAATYRQVSEGRFVKDVCVWAEQARVAGCIATKEGLTVYAEGDFLVFNGADREDGYAMSADRFGELYEAAS